MINVDALTARVIHIDSRLRKSGRAEDCTNELNEPIHLPKGVVCWVAAVNVPLGWVASVNVTLGWVASVNVPGAHHRAGGNAELRDRHPGTRVLQKRAGDGADHGDRRTYF